MCVITVIQANSGQINWSFGQPETRREQEREIDLDPAWHKIKLGGWHCFYAAACCWFTSHTYKYHLGQRNEGTWMLQIGKKSLLFLCCQNGESCFANSILMERRPRQREDVLMASYWCLCCLSACWLLELRRKTHDWPVSRTHAGLQADKRKEE